MPLQLVLLFLAFLSGVNAQATPTPTPNVPWSADAQFIYDSKVSDEFDGKSLNTDIWDEHGIRNPDTNCPTWNGPPSTIPDPLYSTFFPAVEHPKKPNKKVREYIIKDGSIQLRINNRKTKFFKQREYYCDKNTFTCNHDSSIPCYWTNFFGEPVYTDSTNTTYAGIVHDKCKKAPFCIAHFKQVDNKDQRTYTKYSSTHLTGKHLFRYGFIETRVKLANASNILAVWMHGRNSTGPGFCRFRRAEGFLAGVRRECPSIIKSERWQEIDLVEAMNSDIHKKRYIPNIHVFAAHKGEYTSKTSSDNNGEMGGGPIVMNKGLFDQYDLFADLNNEQKVDNEFHWNPGALLNFNKSWAEDWHVLGCYWSANEIRFYADGLEIYRMVNSIVHQPMALDVSASLNVGWSEQIPDDDRIKQRGMVDYVRVWSVLTEDGSDPVSSLPLQDPIARKWSPVYGADMYGVYNRFPHNDDVTLIPVSTAMAVEGGKVPTLGADDIVAELTDVDSLANEGGRPIIWRKVPGSENQPGGARMLYISNSSVHRGIGKKSGFKPAGGSPYTRTPVYAAKSSDFLQGIRFGRYDRVALVKRRSNGKFRAKKINNGAQTSAEWFNPNGFASGFSVRRGDGVGAF